MALQATQTMEADSGRARASASKSGQPFFQIYKKSQGYYTRVGTAVGAGILAAGLADFVYDNINFSQDWAPGIWIKIGIPTLLLVVLALAIYWVVGVKRSSCDFLIATDGEMKKVNWTSRKEIIQATKVVILVTVLTALLLFLIDTAFMWFFQTIDVLQTNGS